MLKTAKLLRFKKSLLLPKNKQEVTGYLILVPKNFTFKKHKKKQKIISPNKKYDTTKFYKKQNLKKNCMTANAGTALNQKQL